MSIKYKITLILGLCTIISIGSFFIIIKFFDNLEAQLLDKCKIEALTGSRIMSETMELFMKTGILTENDIFDTNYRKIEGTNPPKYKTRYDEVFDEHFLKIQDEFLLDPDIDFAILIDKNGYVPTHNSKYALPQSKDSSQNLFYSRSKRIYSGFPAIKQVIMYRGPGIIKTYYNRDTGEQMLNIAASVKVRDKHWGSFLLGVSLDRINAIKNQMTILIATVMFVILSITILILIAIMPRKIFSTDLDIPNY